MHWSKKICPFWSTYSISSQIAFSYLSLVTVQIPLSRFLRSKSVISLQDVLLVIRVDPWIFPVQFSNSYHKRPLDRHINPFISLFVQQLVVYVCVNEIVAIHVYYVHVGIIKARFSMIKLVIFNVLYNGFKRFFLFVGFRCLKRMLSWA